MTTVHLEAYGALGSPLPSSLLKVAVKYFGSTFWVKSPGKIIPLPPLVTDHCYAPAPMVVVFHLNSEELQTDLKPTVHYPPLIINMNHF